MDSIKDFQTYIKSHKKEKSIRLYLDIETFQYNEKAGYKKPSLFKNCTYSVACSWIENDSNVKKFAVSNFKSFFDSIFEACLWRGTPTAKATFKLIIHNGNKYDNHFMLKDILHFYPQTQVRNQYLKSAIRNDFTTKEKDLTKEEKSNGVILEKRVKSSNNLEMDFWLSNIHFVTIDNYMKTATSLRTIGKKLKDLGVATEDELKTDFDYTEYNLEHDISDLEAYQYADKIFHSLNPQQLKYIENDVILLAKCVLYYSTIFKGFDYNKRTFTANILESYKQSPKAEFQLLNQYGKGALKTKVNYTDYVIGNENLYDFIKTFYRGGMNFYNDEYIGTIVKNCFSIDINSSYPYVMYAFKVPSYVKSYFLPKNESTIDITFSEEEFSLYRMTKDTFNKEILSRVKSRVFRQMLVKYYSVNDTVQINTFTLKALENVTRETFRRLTIISRLTFSCEYFEGREKIADFYFTKTQGKLDKKIIMNSPMDYTITDEKNDIVFSAEEIANSKVNLNGLYGIPALRAYFNLFRNMEDGSLESIPNGFKNNERNIAFSTFVTAVAFYNLTSPFHYLAPQEIDKFFVYCDTDSLYLKKEAYNKIPSNFYDPISLGKWDVEHENIHKMYVLNHKKYCMNFYDEKQKKDVNAVRCGGIPLNAFNLDQPFEDFIAKQFHHGAKIKNNKSIYNEQRTVSIYESTTKIDIGAPYPDFYDPFADKLRKKIIEKVKADTNGVMEDALYIETPLGTIGQSELNPVINPTTNKSSVNSLIQISKKIASEL